MPRSAVSELGVVRRLRTSLVKPHLLIFGLCGLLLSACVPLTQIRYHSRHGDIRVCPDTPLSVCLHTTILDRRQQGEIDTTASFAKQPNGHRYNLSAEKIPYVENYPDPSYFMQRDLFLVSSAGRRRRSWPHGDWELHIERTSPHGREIYDASFELYTLIWTPFLGPPN